MQRAIVVVDRGPMEKIGINIFAHEVAIVMAMYGAMNVVVEEIEPTDTKTTLLAEYDRLLRRWPTNDGNIPLVQDVYGRPESNHLLKAMRKTFSLDDFVMPDQEIGSNMEDVEVGGDDDETVNVENTKPEFKLDEDGNRYLNMEEISQGIDVLIGSYDLDETDFLPGKKDKRADLIVKLDGAIDEALEKMDVEVAEDTKRDAKLEALQEAGEYAPPGD